MLVYLKAVTVGLLGGGIAFLACVLMTGQYAFTVRLIRTFLALESVGITICLSAALILSARQAREYRRYMVERQKQRQ